MSVIVASALAGGLSAAICGVLVWRAWALDRPERSWRVEHQLATPSMGGAGVLLGWLVACAALGVPTPVLPLALVALLGMADDRWGVAPAPKLLVQTLAAGLALSTGPIDLGLALPLPGLIATVWLVGCSNAINQVDGLDGLAGGLGVLAALSLGAVALINGDSAAATRLVLLASALGGFLLWNRAPARLFMGDTGALSIGFLLALEVVRSPVIPLQTGVLALAIPVADTLLVPARRAWLGQPLFQSDRSHLHHRLARRLGVKSAVRLLLAAGAVVAFVAVVGEGSWLGLGAGAALVWLVFLAAWSGSPLLSWDLARILRRTQARLQMVNAEHRQDLPHAVDDVAVLLGATAWEVRDADGNVVFSRVGGELPPISRQFRSGDNLQTTLYWAEPMEELGPLLPRAGSRLEVLFKKHVA